MIDIVILTAFVSLVAHGVDARTIRMYVGIRSKLVFSMGAHLRDGIGSRDESRERHMVASPLSSAALKFAGFMNVY